MKKRIRLELGAWYFTLNFLVQVSGIRLPRSWLERSRKQSTLSSEQKLQMLEAIMARANVINKKWYMRPVWLVAANLGQICGGSLRAKI
jgi:hypothetical protein